MSKKLYVGNLSYSTTEQDLQEEIRHKIVQWIHQVNTGIGEGLFL